MRRISQLALALTLGMLACSEEDKPSQDDGGEGDGTEDHSDHCDGDPSQNLQADDADCDGTLTDADCDDNDPTSASVADDNDCDGTPTDADCDDGDPDSNIKADDADCDGMLTDADCDDEDPDSTIMADDADCDGTPTDADCNDEDPESTIMAEDADCDGTPTDADCDDGDPDSNIKADDADCDGTLTDADCDDADPGSTIKADDADCDGTPTDVDCDDEDSDVLGPRWALEFLDRDMATATTSNLLNFGARDSFTISYWARYTSSSEATLIKGDNRTSEYGVQGGNRGIALVQQATGVIASASTPNPLNAWAHYTITYDAGRVSLYLDGSSSGSGSGALGTTSSLSLTIGNHPDGTDAMNGQLAELVIWSTAHSDSDVQDYVAGRTVASDLPGLVAHWAMDEGTGSVAADSSANALDAEILGADWIETCIYSE